MRTPTVDIIIPVWNNPFETRNCLAAIRNYSPDARLIVVDNASNRETELMLEEFSEPLDEAALFMKSERNVGLVKSINMGLALSDSDFAVIVRPHVLVTPNWLDELIDAAKFGMSCPIYIGNNSNGTPKPLKGISRMETSGISFSVLVISKNMRNKIGAFDEDMDGGVWCLADYVKRAASQGYKVFVSSESKVSVGQATVYGSDERIAEITKNSLLTFQNRWGTRKHFAVYFGRIVDIDALQKCLDILLIAARHGHSFTLLLHRKQNSVFIRSGWNFLHTSIQLCPISRIFAKRDLHKKLTALKIKYPEIVTVNGSYGALKNIDENAVLFDEIATLLPKQP